jgi:pimeloyl-ACP methyl ester carboxylesterase
VNRKLAIAGLVLAGLAAGFYLRPLGAIFLYRDLVLWSRGVESRFVEAGGQRMHYLRQGSGAPLVILPGLLAAAADASPLMSALAQRRRVVALDLLGQGESATPDIGYSVPEQSAAVIAFLEAEGGGPVDLLGVSMGGWIALDVAAKRPDLVRRLILASSGGLRFETQLTPETFAPQTIGQLAELIALQSAKPPSPMPEFLARDALRRLKRNEWVALRAARSMITWRDAYDGKLSQVKVPTLVYWGAKDRIIPLEAGRRLAAGIPGARLAIARECGHLAVLECKRNFVEAANAFLDEGGGAAASPHS